MERLEAALIDLKVSAARLDKTAAKFVDYSSYDEDNVKFEIEQEISVKSFSLGTIIKGYKFYEHFGTDHMVTDIKASFHHGRSPPFLRVLFTVISQGYETQKYKLEARYSTFQSIIMQPDGANFVVYLRMINPCLLYVLEDELNRDGLSFLSLALGNLLNHGRECWLRAHEFKSQPNVNIGKCNVMKLVFDKYPIAMPSPLTVMNTLKFYTDHQSPLSFKVGNMLSFRANSNSHYKSSDAVFFKTGFLDVANENSLSISSSVLHAAIGLFTISYQFEDELEDQLKERPCNMNANGYFYNYLKKVCDSGKGKALKNALYDVFYAIDNNDDNDGLLAHLEERLKYHREHDVNIFINGVTFVRRVVLTPTRILLMPPHPYVESRFLRDCDPDYVMRMIIKDDNDEQVSFTICGTGSVLGQRLLLNDRIKSRLDQGIRVGDRVFQFLGCSSSQMRDHGCILYAKDGQGRTAADMLNNIGDLSSIRAVPKFMARVGLAFSQAMGYITIGSSQVVHLPDVKGGINPINYKPYCFSDGVGMISDGLARDVCKMLKIDNIPSAYQIRYKGCKGLVTINPTLPGKKLYLRESMIKFKESSSITLEILKYSKNRQVYLNRPFISLLDQLGTSPEVIIRMQLETIKILTKSFLSSEEAGITLKQLSSLLNAIIPIDNLRNAKIDFLKEPFFRRSLDLLVKRAMLLLKEKARIPISRDKGRTMFGAMDDFNVLKYNQVFIQVSHIKKGPQIITGKVLITKNPCMHPGDVRILDAVDDPRLHHLTDVLIFSATGPRPNPDEMAGSDLDGDEYSVIWDPELFFTLGNQAPMHFPINAPDTLPRDVQVSDMTAFYIKFIQGYNVGMIANNHLAMVDNDPRGIFSEKALKLCEMYAKALDFPKTGHSASLAAKDRALNYPDFMMKSNEKSTYRSDRVLGKLYRQVCLFEDCFGEDAKDSIVSNYAHSDTFFHSNARNFMDEATDAYHAYAKDIDYLVRRFGVDECALLCNVVDNSSKHFTGRKDLKDVQDLIKLLVKNLFDKHKKKFLSSTKGDLTEDQLMAKASAYYSTFCRMNTNNPQTGNGKVLLGFPWIASDYLALLVACKPAIPQLTDIEFSELSSHIDKLFSNSSVQQILTSTLPEELNDKTSIRVKLISSIHAAQRNQPNAPKLSHIRTVLQHYIDDLFSVDHIVPSSDSHLMGFHALSTLNKLLRTANPDHLLATGSNTSTDRLTLQSFCVRVLPNEFKRLVADTMARSVLETVLKTDCGLDRVISALFQINKAKCMRISAVGRHANMLKLEAYLQQPSFKNILRQLCVSNLSK